MPCAGASAVWGLARSWAAETSKASLKLVDLCPGEADLEKDASAVCRDVAQPHAETAWRRRRRFAPRLRKAKAPQARTQDLGKGGHAITGGLGGLPGAFDDAAALWRGLLGGLNAVVPPPLGRPSSGRPSGYLDAATLAGFDPAAFGMAPAEAKVADPQQRLALCCAAEALMGAWATTRASSRGKDGTPDRDVCCFVGATQIDYARLQPRVPSAYTATAVGAIAVVSNRVSYCLDLRGAAATIDTACSSALVALDAAHRRLGV